MLTSNFYILKTSNSIEFRCQYNVNKIVLYRFINSIIVLVLVKNCYCFYQDSFSQFWVVEKIWSWSHFNLQIHECFDTLQWKTIELSFCITSYFYRYKWSEALSSTPLWSCTVFPSLSGVIHLSRIYILQCLPINNNLFLFDIKHFLSASLIRSLD